MTSEPPEGAGGGEPQHPAWPSLEEQLAAAGVIHGSALEQLIQDNQDFAVLRPEEATDRLGIPPWLRVYFRKQHPGGDYSGPGGGYPHLLADVYEWMVTHQDLPSGDGSAGGASGGQ
jgi:hypothetical protein